MDGYARRQIRRAREKVEQEFDKDKNDRPYPSIRNVRLALTKMGVELYYDEFADRDIIEGLPGFGPALQDDAAIRLWLRCEEEYRLAVGKEKFYAILTDCARREVRNPVVEYLQSLQWDGKQRIDTWLATYLGAAETPYSRAVGRLWLIAAVRRAMQPGCKFDEMLVLESEQGKDKSTALKTLAVRDDWFTDDLVLGADTQKQVEQTNGKWIVEAGELKGMRGRQVEFLKSYLSRQTDRTRMAYGRLTREYPRRFVIAGTTNNDSYLQDNTGNRRFWPVKTHKIDLKALRADRDQLWAEAAQAEAQGESIRLDPSLYAVAAVEQGERYERHPWCDLLEAYVQDEQDKVTRDELWAFLAEKGVRPTKQTDGNTLSAAMQELGFTREKRMHFKGHLQSRPGFWRGNKEREIKGPLDCWPDTPSQQQGGNHVTTDAVRN
jgi:predicted P-loop ATPase